MNLKQLFDQLDKKFIIKLLAAHLMLGVFLGYVFFYNVFYYFSAPFDTSISSWVMVLFYALVGFFVGYLFPDPRIVTASSAILPMLGAFFCFIIFISPTFSPDIISNYLSDDLFIMARLVLGNLFLSFLVIFITGFTLYMLDDEFGDVDSFTDD